MRIYILVFLLFSLLGCDTTEKVVKKKDLSNAPKAPFDFYFVRHGETSWGKDDILKGPQDLKLNANGVEQAKQAGKLLKNKLGKIAYDDAKIVTSSLKRAIETAQNVSKITGIAISDYEDGLKERYYGDYRLCEDLSTTPPDAETTEVFQKRVVDALNKVLNKHSSAKPLIIVSHQKVFEWLSEYLAKRTEKLSQGGIGHFILQNNGEWKLEILELNPKSPN